MEKNIICSYTYQSFHYIDCLAFIDLVFLNLKRWLWSTMVWVLHFSYKPLLDEEKNLCCITLQLSMNSSVLFNASVIANNAKSIIYRICHIQTAAVWDDYGFGLFYGMIKIDWSDNCSRINLCEYSHTRRIMKFISITL